MRIFRQRETNGAWFERPEGMPEALHRLLIQRGISSVEEARAFLRPNADGLNPPERLPGIAEAAEILRLAVKDGRKICVYGDYDVDGISASAIMTLTLRRMGAQPEVYLPSRQEEGYGLNEEAIRKIAADCQVLLTVDCGISSVELVNLAKEIGLTVIVTDHHRPGESLPDCTVVNPLVGDYPDPYLCGAGVAFKLCEALLGRENAMEYVDLAALATVADIVPLLGENRVITKLGLDRMNRDPRYALRCLRDVAGMGDKPFTSGMLGFQIGPRLNASGRVGSAHRAFELLTCDDKAKAQKIAVDLNAVNELRKQIEEEIAKSAEQQLKDFDFIAHRAIVLASEGWNSGVIGLSASRLVERYHYPTIMISLNGEVGVGSCRSIPGVDIYQALCAVGDHMVKFGGHAQAAGLTIRREELEGFIADLDAYLKKNVPSSAYIPVTTYDVEAPFRDVDMSLTALLDYFAPTGMGNPAPTFYTCSRVAGARQVGRDGAHLSLRLTDGTNYMRGVAFRQGALYGDLTSRVEAVYVPKANEYAGRSTVEMEIQALECVRDDAELAKEDSEEQIAAFLTEVLYNKVISFGESPAISREELERRLEADAQGTLIVAADAACAAGLSGIERHAGRYPSDPRAFNALCVLPAGECPCGYTRKVYAGMPAPEGCLRLEGEPAPWLSCLPDVEKLRIGYVALRRLLSRPVRAKSLTEYARSLADECSLDVVCLAACVLVLMDMGLVRDAGGFRLAMEAPRKVDPASSRAFQICQELRGGASRE